MNVWDYLNARAMRPANIDQMIAQTQRELSNRTLLLIGAVIALLVFLPKPIDPLVRDILLMLIGGLIGAWATQNNFWYGRPRGAGVPDPTAPGSTVQSSLTVTQVTPAAPVPAPAATDTPAPPVV